MIVCDALVNPDAEYVMVYCVPMLAAVPVNVMPENDATPFEAAAVLVANVPAAPTTDVVAVAVTTVESSSTRLPETSRTSITGCTPSVVPAAVMSPAWVVTTN